jgi:hypothetical protein
VLTRFEMCLLTASEPSERRSQEPDALPARDSGRFFLQSAYPLSVVLRPAPVQRLAADARMLELYRQAAIGISTDVWGEERRRVPVACRVCEDSGIPARSSP